MRRKENEGGGGVAATHEVPQRSEVSSLKILYWTRIQARLRDQDIGEVRTCRRVVYGEGKGVKGKREEGVEVGVSSSREGRRELLPRCLTSASIFAFSIYTRFGICIFSNHRSLVVNLTLLDDDSSLTEPRIKFELSLASLSSRLL